MSKTTKISLTEAKRRLGELAKRSSYANERFVLESHGKPQAVIVTVEDLRKLEQSEHDKERGLKALERLTRLRKQIEARTGIQPDSVESIRQAREERDEQLFGLR